MKMALFRKILRSSVLANASKLFCISSASQSNIRLNFNREIEESVSEQIAKELSAAYAYFAMSSFFASDASALPGFYKLFKQFAQEELEHARNWVSYLNLRGGRAKFKIIEPVEDTDWTPLLATDKAIRMETTMTLELEKLRDLADKHCDYHFGKFVEDIYLEEQYEGLKQLGDLKTKIERVDSKVGIYLLDYDILEKYK